MYGVEINGTDVRVTDELTGASFVYPCERALVMMAALEEKREQIEAACNEARTRQARWLAGLVIAFAGSRGVNINPTRPWSLDEKGNWLVWAVPEHVEALQSMHSGGALTVAPGIEVPAPAVSETKDGWLILDYGQLKLVADHEPQLPPLP